MPRKITGGCLCGSVRYEGTGDPVIQGHCQCRDCQRATGAGHNSIMAVPDADIVVSGTLRFYDKPADSGNIVSRGFCPTCGSTVLSRNDAMPGMLFLTAGCLDDPGQLEPMLVVYATRGHAWDHLDPALPTFPQMPPQFSGH